MKVFYHSDCLLHNPPHEILDGRQTPYQEDPSRITIVRKVLTQEPEHFQISDDLDDALDLKEWILNVHELVYLDYLETAYEAWTSDGGDEHSFQRHSLTFSLLSKRPTDPRNLSPIARAGLYCFDLSSPITKDTFKSIVASLYVTLSAAKTLPSLTSGEGVFALCRPPGHHAMPSLCGGYCYINNVAVAARFLQDLRPDRTKVAILDIDYHHGNRTQDVFYGDPTVLYVSLHAENDYPCEGKGFNINIPLPRGTTSDDDYCVALTRAVNLIKDFDPAYLVVSLGVDIHAEDPISDFKISTGAYIRFGRIISTLEKSTLFVFEGGYHLESIGFNVRNVLNGFQF